MPGTESRNGAWGGRVLYTVPQWAMVPLTAGAAKNGGRFLQIRRRQQRFLHLKSKIVRRNRER